MTEELKMVYEETNENMSNIIGHLKEELAKIRAGRANPAMLEGVKVDFYETLTPINQVANINTLDAHTISVQPWEKAMLITIEKAILNANLGLNPQNNGEMIMINVPPLTEERRRYLCKKAKNEGESAKVGIRNVRKTSNDFIKSLQNDGMSEDVARIAENKIQDITNTFSSEIDKLIASKEKDIMTV